MINKISEIHDLGFEFSIKWKKDISIEVNYTEIIENLNPVNINPPFPTFLSSESTKPILLFKIENDDPNFNFVKENFESILNTFIKTFLDWYNCHRDNISDILNNFDDKRILRNVEEKICRYVKLENLTN